MIAITTLKIVALATCSSLLLGVPLGTAGAFQDQSSAPNSQSATPQNQSQDQGAQGDGSPQSSDDGSQPAGARNVRANASACSCARCSG